MLRVSFWYALATQTMFGYYSVVSSALKACPETDCICFFNVPVFEFLVNFFFGIVLYVIIPKWYDFCIIETVGKMACAVSILYGFQNYHTMKQDGVLGTAPYNIHIIQLNLTFFGVAWMLGYWTMFFSIYSIYVRSVRLFEHYELFAAYSAYKVRAVP